MSRGQCGHLRPFRRCQHLPVETFSSLTSYLELRRSEFLIGGYVGARALLLSAAPQDLSYWPWGHVTCGDKIWSFRTPLPFRHSRVRWHAETNYGHSAPFCHPEAAGPMTSRDQIWSFCTLVSSRGGGPDDTRKYPSGYPYKHSFAICKTERLIACRDWHSLLHLLFLREQQVIYMRKFHGRPRLSSTERSEISVIHWFSGTFAWWHATILWSLWGAWHPSLGNLWNFGNNKSFACGDFMVTRDSRQIERNEISVLSLLSFYLQ